jgi:PhzF family phenazine biosynthesis protein
MTKPNQASWEMFHVDAFAHKPFSGNPAGVLIGKEAIPNHLMQNIAMEMNLSETAFISPNKTRGYNLRWFTPTTEVKLCGHATLSAAHILFERKWVKSDDIIEFHSLSGILKAHREGNFIVLNFPKRTTKKIPTDPEIERILGRYCVGQHRTDDGDLLVEFAHESDIKALAPDIKNLLTIASRDIIITSLSEDRELDFISRVFAPHVGIPEDPVTGSAHCALFPFWGGKLKKTSMAAFQASKRGGKILGELADDRVLLKGQALTLFELKIHEAVFKSTHS